MWLARMIARRIVSVYLPIDDQSVSSTGCPLLTIVG